MSVVIKPGDLFLIDSKKSGPKMVKFLMTAPTVWQHLWRKVRKTQEKVMYYHVGMFADKDTVIEQQWKVEYKNAQKVLGTKNNLLIVRMKNKTDADRARCVQIAKDDLGKNWDILNALGKFLTWLTGIPLFARYIQWPQQEICVCRGGYWWKRSFGEKFGVKTHSELTTHKMHKYIMAHPEKFEIVLDQRDER